ncbi:hypothetical protein GCM10010975_09750 [Comamonas phosphati]|nr:hypothetical protein GCM10010975_09750 [Comamonas phosphati]
MRLNPSLNHSSGASPRPLSHPLLSGLLLASVLALGACSTSAPKPAAPASGGGTAAAPAAKGIQSIARLEPTKGSSVNGVVQFFPRGDGSVQVKGTVQGLAPNSVHGFHIHEKGDCSSGDGLSAGGHFNPGQQAHGKFDGAVHHAGDLPSLTADSQGTASIDFTSRSIALDRGNSGILGRGLIVHNDPDDYTTQPTGNSGARVACAVIERGA